MFRFPGAVNSFFLRRVWTQTWVARKWAWFSSSLGRPDPLSTGLVPFVFLHVWAKRPLNVISLICSAFSVHSAAFYTSANFHFLCCCCFCRFGKITRSPWSWDSTNFNFLSVCLFLAPSLLKLASFRSVSVFSSLDPSVRPARCHLERRRGLRASHHQEAAGILRGLLQSPVLAAQAR